MHPRSSFLPNRLVGAPSSGRGIVGVARWCTNFYVMILLRACSTKKLYARASTRVNRANFNFSFFALPFLHKRLGDTGSVSWYDRVKRTQSYLDPSASRGEGRGPRWGGVALCLRRICLRLRGPMRAVQSPNLHMAPADHTSRGGDGLRIFELRAVSFWKIYPTRDDGQVALNSDCSGRRMVLLFLRIRMALDHRNPSEAEAVAQLKGCDHGGAMEGVMEPTRADQLVSVHEITYFFWTLTNENNESILNGRKRRALDLNKDAHWQDALAATPDSVQHHQDGQPGVSNPHNEELFKERWPGSDEIEEVGDALPAPHDRSDERGHERHLEKEYDTDEDEAFARAVAQADYDDDEAFARAVARAEQGDYYSHIQARIQTQHRPRIRDGFLGKYLPLNHSDLSPLEWGAAFVFFSLLNPEPPSFPLSTPLQIIILDMFLSSKIVMSSHHQFILVSKNCFIDCFLFLVYLILACYKQQIIGSLTLFPLSLSKKEIKNLFALEPSHTQCSARMHRLRTGPPAPRLPVPELRAAGRRRDKAIEFNLVEIMIVIFYSLFSYLKNMMLLRFMLLPSCHPNSTCLHIKVEVTTEASWEFLHVNCRQLSKFLKLAFPSSKITHGIVSLILFLLLFKNCFLYSFSLDYNLNILYLVYSNLASYKQQRPLVLSFSCQLSCISQEIQQTFPPESCGSHFSWQKLPPPNHKPFWPSCNRPFYCQKKRVLRSNLILPWLKVGLLQKIKLRATLDHCKKNFINRMQLTCSMLQPSFHPNSTFCTVTVHQSLLPGTFCMSTAGS
ncbi:hypothetical protein VP01_3024g1 [Puccinia sorghi]|uniref:Uncharacterized protein n=1 Tax=Puccinia sorghi TaxID=27349 RepID=A0A0L6V0W7_9BASI|nr:hypothetical protein VP01_3024g1 [Puccinia sorghi]